MLHIKIKIKAVEENSNYWDKVRALSLLSDFLLYYSRLLLALESAERWRSLYQFAFGELIDRINLHACMVGFSQIVIKPNDCPLWVEMSVYTYNDGHVALCRIAFEIRYLP